MSPFELELLPEAEAEAEAAFHWYFDRSPLAADAFRVELVEALDWLTTTAMDWPEDEDGIRRYHLRHFPYTVWYELGGQLVTVLAIAHQRRRPGYWQSRQGN